MQTTELSTEEMIGRKLAELAVNVNDFGPPTYLKYLDAFLQAHFLIENHSAMWDNRYEVDVLANMKLAFNGRIEELFEQHQF